MSQSSKYFSLDSIVLLRQLFCSWYQSIFSISIKNDFQQWIQDHRKIQFQNQQEKVVVTLPYRILIILASFWFPSHYMAWSRAIKLTFKSNMKLGFIDGKYKMPPESSLDYDLWGRADNMVTSWILNTISRDMVDTYFYSKELREEIWAMQWPYVIQAVKRNFYNVRR